MSLPDEDTNDSIFSTKSRLKDEENLAKLGEIADRLDSFFCEDDPILLPNSTQTTSEPPYNNKKRSRRQSSNGSNYSNQTTKSSTKRRSKDSVTSDSGLGKKNFSTMGFLDRSFVSNSLRL